MKPVSLIMALSAALFAHAAQGADIQPGSWKLEVSVAMENTPPVPTQPTTACLKSVNEMVQGATACSAKTTSATGNRVAMKLWCKTGGTERDGTGNLTVSPTAVDGTFNLNTHVSKGPTVKTVSKLHAVRVGDCPGRKR